MYKKKTPLIWLNTLVLLALLLATFATPALGPSAQAATTQAGCSLIYKSPGDESLQKLAKRYSVSLTALARANDLPTSYVTEAGDKICIPNKNWRNEPNAKLLATPLRSKKVILVEASGLNKSTAYIVRVKDTNTNLWYKLGKVKSDNKGVLKQTAFTFPKDLLKKPYLTVCLKNLLKDTLVCKSVLNP
jgi:LysM repeat protein